MELKNYISTKLNYILALSATFLFASCGSYQYVGYDNDGIYDTDEVVYENERDVQEEISTEANSSSYYKNYFKEKSDIVEASESEIFTDIDSYEGTALQDDNYVESPTTGYAGWGQNSSEIAINFYDNGPIGFGPWGYYGAYGLGWGNPYWGGYWGRGFYGRGFGIGFGFYDPFFYGGGFGYGGLGWGYNRFGYGYPFYGHRYNRFGYGNRYYGNNGISYNSGRRSSAAQLGRRSNNTFGRERGTLTRSNRTRVSSDGSLIRRPRTEISRNGVGVSPNRRGNNVNRSSRPNTRAVSPNRTTRPRVNSTPRGRSNSSTRSSSTRSRPTTTRSSSRSSNRSFSRSSSSSRSSGSVSRSSGSSSRSSGRRNN